MVARAARVGLVAAETAKVALAEGAMMVAAMAVEVESE